MKLKVRIPVLFVILLLSGMLVCAGGQAEEKLQFDNPDFYDANGKFQEDKAKEAYVALMKYHGYPVYEGIREKLWVTDYGKGEFTKVGLGVFFFINNVENRYMLLDLFLLPNQMLPEHWHVAGEGNPPKMEGWVVRYGLSHIVGVGDPNLGPDVQIPKCHMNGTVTVKHDVAAKPGNLVFQPVIEGKHWQCGGPEGAIVTEVANVHTDSVMLYSDPAINEWWQSTVVK